MDRPQTSAIVGVDGGGTSTKAIVVDSHGTLIGNGTAGPSNPNNTSYEAAASNILAAIDNALAGLARRANLTITSACLGIAGIATEDQRTALKAALLTQRPSLATTNLTITHDLEIAHQAIYGDKPGTILIAGTGSAIYTRDANGQIHRISGRTYKHHEDPGSGYAIGKQAIESKLLPPTKSRQEIASRAPQVIKLAESGNQVALQILTSEASHLAKLASNISNEFPITIVGGILESKTIYQNIVLKALTPKFTINSPALKLRCERGALQLAWKEIGNKSLL